MAAQVEIIRSPVTWKIQPKINEKGSVFYDDYHQEIIFVRKDKILTSHFASSKLLERKISVVNHDLVINAKFSPDRRYVALQISRDEMKIIDDTGRLIALRKCSSDRILLNFYWVHCEFAHIMLITSQGPEFYKITGNRLKCVRTIKYNTAHHWYLPRHHFLLLVDDQNIFQGFTITTHSVPKKSKFEIVSCTSSSLDESKSYFHQVNLLDFYGRVTCSFIDEVKGQLHLFGLEQGVMHHTNVFDLFAPGVYCLSVIDNVLIVHNLNGKVPVLFDVNSDSDSPILPPIPIFSKYHKQFGEDKQLSNSTGDNFNGKDEGDGIFDRLTDTYADNWIFLPPCYVLENTNGRSATTGQLFELTLNLRKISESWSKVPRDGLIEFLSKRDPGDSKQLMLKVVRDMIDGHTSGSAEHRFFTSLDALSRIFSKLNKVCYQASQEIAEQGHLGNQGSVGQFTSQYSPKSPQSRQRFGSSPSPRHMYRNSARSKSDSVRSPLTRDAYEQRSNSIEKTRTGNTIISQVDMFNQVFVRFSKESDSQALSRLIGVLTEYIRSVGRMMMAAIPQLPDLLIDLLLKDRRFYQLHQLLQYHILQDSEDLAMRLLEIEQEYEPAYQLSIDMLTRLQSFKNLTEILLKKNKVLFALRLISKFDAQKTLTEFPRAERYLRCAFEQDSTIYFVVYNYFTQRNMDLNGTTAFDPSEECEVYEEAYKEMFYHQLPCKG